MYCLFIKTQFYSSNKFIVLQLVLHVLFSSAKEGQQCPLLKLVWIKLLQIRFKPMLSLFCCHCSANTVILCLLLNFSAPKNLFQLSLLDGFVLAFYGPVPVQQEPGNEAANLSYRRTPTMYPLIYSTCSLKQGKNALLHACNYVMPFHTLLPQTS